MKRDELKDTPAELERMDKFNNNRVHNSRKRVAKIIRELTQPVECQLEGHGSVETLTFVLSKSSNILEDVLDNMKHACEYWTWDSDICYQIEDVIGHFGKALAILLADNEDIDNEELDMFDVNVYLKEGFNLLGCVIATLTRWFDE